METGALRNFLATLLVVVATSPASPPVAPPPAPPVETKGAPLPRPSLPRDRSTTVAQRTTPTTQSSIAVSVWRERAEDTSQVTPTLGSDRSLVQGDVLAEGSGAFHLANPSFTDETFTLDPAIRPDTQTKLFFEGRLGYATVSQFARVQVSANEGASWTTIWSRQGSDDAGDSGFGLQTVSLSSYAGTDIRLRFLYEFTGSSAYTGVQTSPPVGWFIDDIQIGSSFIKRPYTETGDPTAREVILLEFINRARADAAAEAARMAATDNPDVLRAMAYFSVDTMLMSSQFAALTQSVQPLAMNARLTAAARLHSEDMLANVFQGHMSSASPPAPNMTSDTIANRVARQGYEYSSVSENVYAFAESPWHAHASFEIDWGDGPGGMQDPAGHRLAIHNGIFREVGIGAITGTNTDGATTVGPLLVTQDFGVGPGSGQPLITGVTYLDADDDGFYDEGEGLGNVRVEVDGSSYYTTSSTHGAYAVPVPGDGTYQVSFQRPGFPPVSQSLTVTGNLNVKADYLGQSIVVERMERPTASSVRLHGRQTGPLASVELQVSGDLLLWTNIPHTQTLLPGDLLQIDGSLTSSPLHHFFRVRADWPSP